MAKKSDDGPSVPVSRRAELQKLIDSLGLPKGAIGFGDDPKLEYEKIQTPFQAFNKMTGGFPKGKFTCIAGPPQTSKTTLCLHTIAYNQEINENFQAAFVDIENSFDPVWATIIGVDLSRLVLVQRMPSLEDYLNAMIGLVDTGQFDMIVVDSVGAAAPLGEIQSKGGEPRDLKDDMIGIQPRKYSQFFRAATPKIATSNCAAVMVAQVYTDIGNPYGGLKVMGGLGFQHRTHLRVMLRRSKDKSIVKQTMADGSVREMEIGHNVHIKVDKTKQNDREGAEITLPFRRGVGIAVGEAAILVGLNLNLIKRSGASYEWGDLRARGYKALVKLFEDEEQMKLLQEKLDTISLASPDPINLDQDEETTEETSASIL